MTLLPVLPSILFYSILAIHHVLMWMLTIHVFQEHHICGSAQGGPGNEDVAWEAFKQYQLSLWWGMSCRRLSKC